jgi:hypothetical protein
MSTAIENRARRAAKRVHLVARKSRARLGSIDNYGGFMLVNAHTNFVVAGERFNLSPEDVIEYCTE